MTSGVNGNIAASSCARVGGIALRHNANPQAQFDIALPTVVLALRGCLLQTNALAETGCLHPRPSAALLAELHAHS